MPENVKFDIKQGDKHQLLCEKDYKRLLREIQKVSSKEREKEEGGEKKEKENEGKGGTEIEKESLEIAHSDSKGPSESRRGRKPKYSPEDKLRMALTALQNASLTSSGVIFNIFSSNIEDLEKEKSKPASRTIVSKALMELYECFKHHLAKKLSISECLSLTIDTTTDSQRELMAILFAGLEGGEDWEELVAR